MSAQQIVPFLFEGESLVRVIERDDRPWFVAADLCQILSIRNVSDAVGKLDEDEKGIALTDTLRGPQEAIIVSEGGLYTLILRSRGATKPGTIAHRFRRWVTDEVLPSIRRHGTYQQHGTEAPKEGLIVIPEDLSTLPISQKLDLLTTCRLTWGIPATQEMWVHIRCPIMPSMDTAMRQRPLDLGEGREVAIFPPRTVDHGEAR